jgi:hypothetical protein
MNEQARSRWAEAGALGAAGTVAATIFCCLPFATGLIGAGVAAFGARFAPFQPYLAGLSLASLGYAFYQAYRPGSAGATPRPTKSQVSQALSRGSRLSASSLGRELTDK